MKGPFEGVRVLSLAEQYPGPYATVLMADLGADVILIERPAGGDPARAFPDFFAAISRNKRSACIDLKSAKGKDQLKQLVTTADVLLEGFRPGTMARLGVAYADLEPVNPRLVYASISGFGQSGPYRDRVAHDLSYQAISGLLFADEAPRTPAVSYADLAGAMFTAFAIATALFGRERTGKGTYIDVSMTDCLVSWMNVYIDPKMNCGAPITAHAEPGYGAFRCADGSTLTLSIAHEDHFWRLLCVALALPELQALHHQERVGRSNELRHLLQSRLSKQPLEHWARILDEKGIPWSPLNDLGKVIEDPHFRERGLFASVRRGDGTMERHVRQPLQFSAYGTAIKRPVPRLGEHTGEVIRVEGHGPGHR
jgi:crotonobetainyl-CoA:carnitine CoA-transferase CaiB-like acyl-CoA transferase